MVTFICLFTKLSMRHISYVAIKFSWNWSMRACVTWLQLNTLLAATCSCQCVNTEVGRMLPYFLKVRPWLLLIVIANACRIGNVIFSK